MFEYTVLLFALSILLLLLYLRFKDKVPLSPRVVYCTLGISFTLGLFFPLVVTRTNTGGILVVYAFLILLSSTALSFLENRASTNVSPEPLKVSELEMRQNTWGESFSPSGQNTSQEREEETGQPESFAEFLAEELTGKGYGVKSTGEREGPAVETEEQTEVLSKIPAEGAARDIEKESKTAQDEAVTLFNEHGGKEPPDGEAEIMGSVVHEPTPVTPAPAPETAEPETLEVEGDASSSDWITAGFAAKNRGNFTGALTCFFKALNKSPGVPVTALIALEISSIYQELGQYSQAALALKTITLGLPLEDPFKQRISYQLVYLERLEALLEAAKIKGAPYSKVPSLIKIKANMETHEKLKIH